MSEHTPICDVRSPRTPCQNVSQKQRVSEHREKVKETEEGVEISGTAMPLKALTHDHKP